MDDLSQLPLSRFGTGFGKPHFFDLTNVSTGVLSDLIDVDSWLIFPLLALDTAFFHKLASRWYIDDSFQSSKQKVKVITSVNEVVERGIKLRSVIWTAHILKKYINQFY